MLFNKCLLTFICFVFQKFVMEFSSFHNSFGNFLIDKRTVISHYCLPITWCMFNVSVQILQKFKNPFSSREMDWIFNLALKDTLGAGLRVLLALRCAAILTFGMNYMTSRLPKKVRGIFPLVVN